MNESFKVYDEIDQNPFTILQINPPYNANDVDLYLTNFFNFYDNYSELKNKEDSI